MHVSTDALNITSLFYIHTLSNEAECYEELKDAYGSVHWEAGSSDHRNCAWRINSPVGKPVLLHFTGFKVGAEAAVCESNYVSVFDVNDGTETELGRWCGAQGEELWLLSAGSSLLVRLHTDRVIDGDYFDANYVSTNCQFDVSEPNTQIISPPEGVVSNDPLRCLWKIHLPTSSQLRLQFQEFN
ncbi:Tolloid-like protein 2, partial [Clonorchis sinensis]